MTKTACRFLTLVCFAVSCASAPNNDPVSSESTDGSARLRAPSRATFRTVHDALQTSCGSLDCHGQIGRNLRMYGGRGLRLAATDTPGEGATTDAEYDASYRSLVGLEPEILNQVLQEEGRLLSRLSVVRKARGIEKHKGGICMKPFDPMDRCLVAWLTGGLDRKSCEIVTLAPRPQPELPAP